MEAPFLLLLHQHPRKRIKKLGAKLAEFFVKHPSLRFTAKDALDAHQVLPPYLGSIADIEVAPYTSGTLAELHLYLECQVVKNLIRLLEGLIDLCNPKHLDDVCEKALAVYGLAFGCLARIAEHAAAQVKGLRPEGRAVALKLLDQLQPADNEQAPGMLFRAWGVAAEARVVSTALTSAAVVDESDMTIKMGPAVSRA
jgi:hypothetical protein